MGALDLPTELSISPTEISISPMEMMKGRLRLSGPAPGCTGTAACDGIPNLASLILSREGHAKCVRSGTVDAWSAVQVECAGAEVQT